MNNPLGVSPSKGNQGTTRGKEKSFDLGGNRTHDLRIRSTVTLPTELRGRTEKVGDDLDGESKVRVHMNVVPRHNIHMCLHHVRFFFYFISSTVISMSGQERPLYISRLQR